MTLATQSKTVTEERREATAFQEAMNKIREELPRVVEDMDMGRVISAAGRTNRIAALFAKWGLS